MKFVNFLRQLKNPDVLFNPLAREAAFLDAMGKSLYPLQDQNKHLDAAMHWLCRAQDATPDGGVSRSYHIATEPFLKFHGWSPSYPETTGYIIETMYDYAAFRGDDSYRDRAYRMAVWETEIQMETGAVQGGVFSNKQQTPAIFNTGQVLLGWDRTWRETKNELFLSSAKKAANFLVKSMDEDGAWRKSLSHYAMLKQNTYNARTAYALAQFSKTTGESVYAETAARNLDFVLSLQHDSGWFESCCLIYPDKPLIHTLAYTIRGLLEGYIHLGVERFLLGAKTAADALLDKVDSKGYMNACFDKNWNGMEKFSCLTGEAQMCVIWYKLFDITGDNKYKEKADLTLSFLMSTQDMEHGNDGIRGGIKGSYPLWGWYGYFSILNWAVKFFADALILKIEIERS